jgi:hypothetical protein
VTVRNLDAGFGESIQECGMVDIVHKNPPIAFLFLQSFAAGNQAGLNQASMG